jgi:hypothetical protein
MDFEKPDEVKKAQQEGNHEALSKMGRKGAKVANENRAIRKEWEEMTEQEKRMDAQYQELLHEHGEERAKEILDDLQ